MHLQGNRVQSPIFLFRSNGLRKKFFIFVQDMCRLLVILSLVMCCIGLNQADDVAVRSCAEGYDCAVNDCYDSQLSSQHRRNLDIDFASVVCVPSCNTAVSHNVARNSVLRVIHNEVVGRNVAPICRYCTSGCIHRLSLGERAVEYYLYTLCRIRI